MKREQETDDGDEQETEKRLKTTANQQEANESSAEEPVPENESSSSSSSDESSPESTHPEPSEEQLSLQAAKRFLIREAKYLGFKAWLERHQDLTWRQRFNIFDLELDEEGFTQEELQDLLKRTIIAATGRRERIESIHNLDHVVELFKNAKNIVVLTGAGVSVSCGIPDFRSKNGIYSRLDEFELDDPQQMFDIEYFRYFPQTFYSFAKEIYPSNFEPSPSHMFIKLLESRGVLLRNYTQNIDTLEQMAGIERVVQCHGSFATASCITCGLRVQGKELEKDIFKKEIPYCIKCKDTDRGIMKPDIVFFGEKLPDHFAHCFLQDRLKMDLLVVIGSSLKVSPVAEVVGKYFIKCLQLDRIPHEIPQVLINLESLPHANRFDVQLLGHCDVIVKELSKKLGWQLPVLASHKEYKNIETQFIHPNKVQFRHE